MSREKGFFRQNLLKWLPGVMISLGAVIFLVFFIDWSGFLGAINAFSVSMILLLIGIATSALFFRSLAWWILLNREARIIDCFLIESVGYLLNNFLPLRLGEFGRAILMGQRTKRGTMYSLSSVGIERTMDMGFAAITLLVSIPLLGGTSWSKATPIYTILVVFLVLFTVYLVARNHSVIIGWFQMVGSRWAWFGAHVSPLIESLINGMRVFTSLKTLVLTVLLLGIAWLGYYLNFYIVIKAIAPQAPFWWALVVNGIVSLGIAIPSAPGSIGVWEASFVGALALMGVDESKGIASAVVLHLMNYFFTGVLGLIGLIKYGSSFSTIYNEITKRKSNMDQERMKEGL